MHWQIPKMWDGGECWIIGGGPSIALQFEVPEDIIQGVLCKSLPMSAYSPFLSPIHGKHVIGVNVAFMLGNWVDIVFFGDAGFYLAHKKQLAEFPKLKITSNAIVLNKHKSFDVKLVPKDGNHPEGISPRANRVSWNSNSGGASISLAVQLGAKRIYLLGFDMKLGLEGLAWPAA